ncbi:MAG: hypothetical protein GWM87_06390 [Xanthomonadales bacterium]|nr:hypothetical protein [Xanthomonadales bacterium]NIX12598.1 hypothetical protein [Xanthomonadales bacterium]
MTISRGIVTTGSALSVSGLLLAALLLVGTSDAMAVTDTVSAADEQCLTCHSMAGLKKSMGDGDRMSLHVDRAGFADSVHSILGCRGCHRNVEPSEHPVMRSIANAGTFSVEESAVCRNCHAGKFEQYDGSIHASLVASGDAGAPICSNCHDPHTVQRATTYDPASGRPCKACHEDVFDAYAGSVHGRAKLGEGQAQAPFCSDCHQAHGVTAVAAGDRLKQVCLSCHDGALLAHDEWLPNSGRHLESVACPACHSPMAERSVDLRLYDSKTHELVAADPGFDERLASIDTAGDGLDPFELWALVRETSREREGTVTLRGRLEVGSGVQAHQLALKHEAVRDCGTCHQHGAAPYASVTVSVSGADGRRVRYEAEEETLTSAVSVGSVGGFYTAGGTRIRILDLLLVLGILAGLGIPTAHWTMRRLSRRKG